MPRTGPKHFTPTSLCPLDDNHREHIPAVRGVDESQELKSADIRQVRESSGWLDSPAGLAKLSEARAVSWQLIGGLAWLTLAGFRAYSEA